MNMIETAQPNIHLTAKHNWQIIFLVSISHASSHFFQLVLPSLYISLGLAFGFDFAKIASLVSAFYIVSSIGQASSGFIVDRIGARSVLWFGLTCFIVSGIVIGLSVNYLMLFCAAIIGGIGNAIFHPADYSIINQLVSQKYLGHAFSAHSLSGNLGWALTPVLITTITLLFNWRIAAFSASALILATLIMTILGRNLLKLNIPNTANVNISTSLKTNKTNKSQINTQSNSSNNLNNPNNSWHNTLKTLLAKPALWGAFLFFAFTSIPLSSVQNYTIPLLGKLYGLSQVSASSTQSGYMFASAFGMLAGGFLASATQRAERTVMVFLIFAGLLLIALALGLVPTIIAAPIFMLVGFCSGIAAPSRDMLIRRVTPKGATGSVYGLVYSGMDVGSACAPLLFGILLDRGIFQGPWIGAGLAFIVAAALAQWIAIKTQPSLRT